MPRSYPPSSVVRSWTCSRQAEPCSRWPRTCRSAIRASTTGESRTASTPAWSREPGRAGGGASPDRRTGDRSGRAQASRRAAARGGVPKRRFEAIAVMAAEGLPIQTCCRVLDVSDSGFYAWRKRPALGPRPAACLADRRHPAVHAASHGVFGGRSVHAELVLGHGISVGHGAVAMLMRRTGLKPAFRS